MYLWFHVKSECFAQKLCIFLIVSNKISPSCNRQCFNLVMVRRAKIKPSGFKIIQCFRFWSYLELNGQNVFGKWLRLQSRLQVFQNISWKLATLNRVEAMDLWSMSTEKEHKTIKSRKFFCFFLYKICFVICLFLWGYRSYQTFLQNHIHIFGVFGNWIAIS